MSAQDLWELPPDGQRHWLIEGALHTSALAGTDHGRHAMHLSIPLGAFIYRHGLGAVYAAETGFLLARDPDTVLAADLAFVRRDRVRPFGPKQPGYFPGHPDFAVEVVSPGDSAKEVADKVELWLAHKTHVVLTVVARRRHVTFHRPGAGPGQRQFQTLSEADQLTIDDLFPGWSMPVASLFAEMPSLTDV